VFDVGAHIGTYSDLYLEIGARVVAIEPNPELARVIKRRLPDVRVETCAVADIEGTADFYVGRHSSLGTLSRRFAGMVEEEYTVELTPFLVPVTTLPRLFEKYGVPDSLKIDVEGAECRVLSGMGDVRPELISFEFQSTLLDEASACLELLAGRRFRICVAQNFAWESDWLDATGVVSRIRELGDKNAEVYGDVYAFPHG
jgi:FkbM family methyltransferase